MLGLAEVGQQQQPGVLIPVSVSRPLLAAALWLSAGAAAAADTPCSNTLPVTPAPCAQGNRCEALLAAEPKALPVRLALCDVLANAGDLDAARRVISDGETVHAGDSSSIRVLALAESNLAELAAAPTRRAPDAAVLDEYLLLRCEQYRRVDICEELLTVHPDLAPAWRVIGDDALERGDFRKAITSFRRAQALDATDAVREKLTAAEALRAPLLTRCFDGSGGRARDACREAMMPGEPDEGRLWLRLGDLELRNDQPGRADAAYARARGLGENLARSRQTLVADIGRCRDDAATPAACEAALAGADALGSGFALADELEERLTLLANAAEPLPVTETDRDIDGEPGAEPDGDGTLAEIAVADPSATEDAGLADALSRCEDLFAGGIDVNGLVECSALSQAGGFAAVPALQNRVIALQQRLDTAWLRRCRDAVAVGDIEARPICLLALDNVVFQATRTPIEEGLDMLDAAIAVRNEALELVEGAYAVTF